MERFDYVLPKNADEARAALAEGATAKAGGIDILDRMKEGIARPKRLVRLTDLRPEEPVVATPEGVWISAFSTLSELADHHTVRGRFPALAKAAVDAATPQIRNAATVGGNLLQEPRCWYYRTAEFSCRMKGGEGCPAVEGENQYHAILGYGECPTVHPSNLAPALLALGAIVEIHGEDEPKPIESLWSGVPKEGFGRLPARDWIVTGVRLPRPGPNAYVEVRQRQSFDWALAAAAAAMSPEGEWRVVLGGVAPLPWRATAAETALGRGKPDAEKIAKAADASVSGAKPLSKNAYKVQLARVAVKRALTEAAGGAK